MIAFHVVCLYFYLLYSETRLTFGFNMRNQRRIHISLQHEMIMYPIYLGWCKYNMPYTSLQPYQCEKLTRNKGKYDASQSSAHAKSRTSPCIRYKNSSSRSFFFFNWYVWTYSKENQEKKMKLEKLRSSQWYALLWWCRCTEYSIHINICLCKFSDIFRSYKNVCIYFWRALNSRTDEIQMDNRIEE